MHFEVSDLTCIIFIENNESAISVIRYSVFHVKVPAFSSE